MNGAARSLVLACSLAVSACSPFYVIRAGIEEAKILSRRRPIARVIEDPATAAETRRKLSLVLQARDFAAHALDLDVGESYTTYSWVESDTLLLVVTASAKDRFRAHTWWFPIVGNVPYKGFFNFDSAFSEAERLEQAGLDVQVRPSSAFSTLGWFNDPVLNTLLRYDDVSLAGTVIHELLHNTIYIPSRIAFNESFANFVGERGAIEFFCNRDGDDSRRCGTARDAWADNLRYADFLSALVTELETIYNRDDLDRQTKLARREVVFAQARE
ncbi:MAG: aminopeptidase, partial [Longimicrobiales bacterium]